MHKQFSKETRTMLAVLLRAQESPKKCAEVLGFDKSAITKEIARNRDEDEVYRGSSAHKKYLERRKKAKQRSRKIGNG